MKGAMLPRWKRGDLTDRLKNHMHAESVFERRVGDTLQVVERLVPRDSPTQDARPFYRLVEVRNNRPRAVCVADTQRDARAAADKRVLSQRDVRARGETTVACLTGLHDKCNGIGTDDSGEFYCACPCHQGGDQCTT